MQLPRLEDTNSYIYIYLVFFLTLFIGCMGKLRKNLENTNAFAQATHKDVLEIKATLSKIEFHLQTLGIQVQKATSRRQ